MTDHLTNAILAAARLDDIAAANHLGYVVDLDEPHAIAHITAGSPYLRASMERGGYLHADHDEASAVCLMLRAQHEAEPEHIYATLARRGFQLVADVAKRSRDALDAANATTPDEATDPSPSKASHAIALAIRAQSETDPSPSLASLEAMGYPHLADLARWARAQIAASRSARVVAGSFEITPSPWHPYATREEWEAACDAMARALGGPL